MIVAHDVSAAAFGPCALTIGNFDGVHCGHRALLRATVEEARTRGVKPAVLMFNPHPICVVAPDRAPRLLTNVSERCALLAEQGIEAVLIQPFTTDLAHLSPQDFARRFLRDALQARVVLVGEGFRFGYKQSGDTAMLTALGKEYGFDTRFVPAVEWRGEVVSASQIRKLVLAGNVDRASRLLGRPHFLEGEIVSGHGVGHKQTVPTLNLSTDAQVIPARGVYVTRTTEIDDRALDMRRWNSITNIGYRPTFGGDVTQSIETFLLDPYDGATPARIRLEFLHRVREERKFESPEALKAQILRDAAQAKAYFRRRARWTHPTQL